MQMAATGVDRAVECDDIDALLVLGPIWIGYILI
jgi:hypothetical protein